MNHVPPTKSTVQMTLPTFENVDVKDAHFMDAKSKLTLRTIRS